MLRWSSVQSVIAGSDIVCRVVRLPTGWIHCKEPVKSISLPVQVVLIMPFVNNAFVNAEKQK